MKHFFVLLLACGTALLSTAQPAAKFSISRTVDTIVKQQQWAAAIPGLAVGVWVNNEVVYRKATGVESLANGKRLNSQSDFHLASVSKPFAGTAILQLAEQGKLYTDSTLVHYLPYFTMKDTRYKKITLYQLLTHSSGIPDVTDYEWGKPQYDKVAALRYAKSFASRELDFEPGTQFNYSNAAYNLLAAVIHEVSGVSFEEYLQKNILLAAGMKNSSFLLTDIAPGRRTAPHIIDDSLRMAVSTTYPYNRIHAPSSTLHSNLDDMLQWTRLFLQKGMLNGKRVISETTWQKMLQPQLKVTDKYTVCYSWFETTIGGKKIYFHSGGDLGYRSFAGFEPEGKIAVVLMGNNELFDAAETGLAIFRSILLQSPAPTLLKPVHLELKKHVLTNPIEKLKQVYGSLKQSLVPRYDTSASSLLTLAAWLFDRNHRQQTTDVLQWGASLYPADAAWYGHLGDVHSAWGEKQKAIVYYRHALRIDPAKEELLQKIKDLEN